MCTFGIRNVAINQSVRSFVCCAVRKVTSSLCRSLVVATLQRCNVVATSNAVAGDGQRNGSNGVRMVDKEGVGVLKYLSTMSYIYSGFVKWVQVGWI